MTRSIIILKSQYENIGGAEKYARTLADKFHQKGWNVTILTTGPISTPTPFEVISHRLKSKTSLSKLWEFEGFCDKMIQSKNPDIILGLDRNRFQTHLRASSGVHKAYLDHRKNFDSPLKRFRHVINPLHSSLLHIEKIGFEHPDLKILFTNSHLIKDEILSHYIVDPKKIKVVHNGVQWHDFQENFDSTQKSSSRYEFVFIGSGFERKGLRSLLMALPHLSTKDFHLSVIGYDKKQKAFLKLTQSLHIEDKVTFYGPQKDVITFLQKADCLVIPSFYDPFANVTLEALAMGLFVVSSKTNGASEVLNEKTGKVIENLQNNESVISSLETALLHPKTPQSSKLIRESVKHLDFSTQLNTYLDLCLSATS